MKAGPKCHDHGICAIGPDELPEHPVMVIGIAPGHNEMKEGQPFVGASGALARGICSPMGIDWESFYVTNLCCWRPPDDQPTDEDMALCEPRLMEEIRTVAPRLIITMGALATERLTGHKVSEVRGQPLLYTDILGSGHSCRVMGSWHPAAFLHTGAGGYIVDLVRDFQKLTPPPSGVSVLDWPDDHGKFDWWLVDNDSAFQYMLSKLDHDYPVSIDIETGDSENVDEMSMDVQRQEILCFAVSQDLPSGTWAATFTPEAYQMFAQWYSHYGAYYKWTTHYGYFDKQGIDDFLRELGCDVPFTITFDTLARSIAIDERQGVHKLKTLAREYIGCDVWEQPLYTALECWSVSVSRLAKYEAWAFDHQEPGDPVLPELSDDQLCEYLPGSVGEVLRDCKQYKSRRGMSDEAVVRYNARLEDAKFNKTHKPGFNHAPRPILYYYNGGDAAHTAQLLPVLTSICEWDEVEQVAEFLELDMNINAEITAGGVHIDLMQRDKLVVEWGELWEEQHTALRDEAEAKGYTNADGTQLNLASPRQKATFIYDMLGIEQPETKHGKTKTGQMSTSIKLLGQAKGQDPWLDAYIDFVHLDHSLGSYVLPMPGFVRGPDSFIYPQWKPHAARTYRDSYAKPPQHQLPGYDETGGPELQAMYDCPPRMDPHDPNYRARIAFTIHDAIYAYIPDGLGGWWFVCADYSRAEFYVMAYYSGDKNLLTDVTSFDMHAATAASVIARPPKAIEDVTKWERYFAKRFNFGKAYNMQPDTMAKEWLHCPVYEALRVDRAWNERYSVWVDTANEWKRTAIDTGELVSPATGCKRRWRLIEGEASYHELNQSINFPIQNTACWVTKSARIKLHETWKALPQNQHYLIKHPDGSIESPALDLLNSIMTQQHLPDPIKAIPVEVKVGTRWSDAHVVDLDSATGMWHFKEEN